MMKRSRLTLGILLASLAFLGASCGTPSDGGVFKSEDQGETWAQKVFVDQQKKKTITVGNANVDNMYVDPKNSDVMYLGTKENGLYKTVTAGEQWIPLSTGATRIRDLAIDANNTDVLFSTRGTEIIKSVDAGEHWDTVYTDPRAGIIMQVTVDWYNSQHIIATNSIGAVVTSTDGGITWKVTFQVDEPLSALIMDPQDSRIMYIMELEKQIYRTVDSGVTWTELFTDEYRFANGPATVVRSLVMDPNNSHTFYITTPDGIYRSTDSGATWEYVTTLIEKAAGENNSIRNVTVEPGNSNVLYFTIDRIVHKTVDGSQTWKTIENFPSARRITSLTIATDRPQILYAGTELVEQKKGLF